MNFDINKHSIYIVNHGSVAYGTNTPESDIDVKGVLVSPLNYYLGLQRFDQFETYVSKGGEQDKTIYDVQKFIKLAADNNPNIIECLFVDDVDVIYINNIGHKLRENRDLFVSKKIRHKMAGFAYSQIKRIKKEEYPNPKMCKHAYHLVRLMRMAKEVLEGKGVIVKRKEDREELLSIRNGAWTYDQLTEWFNKQDAELNDLYIKSTLPLDPDRKKLDQLCMDLICEFHGNLIMPSWARYIPDDDDPWLSQPWTPKEEKVIEQSIQDIDLNKGEPW